MSTIAIGDVHGNLQALDDLLARVLLELDSEDTLVFLGDYIDGPDSRGCVERILQLKRAAAFPVVTLLGNHEQWMLRSLRDPTRHSWILGMDAFATIASYSDHAARTIRGALESAGVSVITARIRLPYQIFVDLLPPHHMRFFQDLQLFHRTPDVTCVHAGIDLQGRVTSQDVDVFTWGPHGFPDRYCGDECVVYGHWGNAARDENEWPRPVVKMNRTYGIDTISTGVLTAMRFPDGRIFQSKRHRFS